jgi:transposase
MNQHATQEDKAGIFAWRLKRKGESLGVVRDVPGVECTNNVAERAHRFGVIWRKRSQGTCSAKGNHWVERVLSLRHTLSYPWATNLSCSGQTMVMSVQRGSA